MTPLLAAPALGVTRQLTTVQFLVLEPWDSPGTGVCLTDSLSFLQRCPLLRHLRFSSVHHFPFIFSLSLRNVKAPPCHRRIPTVQ